MRNRIRTYNTPQNCVVVRTVGEATVIGGLAAPFYEEIKFQGQREQILPTAFDKVLAGNDDVRLFTDHQYKVENLLATRKGGNLKLSKSDRGLEYEATLPTPMTDKTKHIVALAQRGELGASVGWRSSKEDYVDGVRNFSDLQINEISLTPIPAYPTTTVEQRSMNNNVWLEVLKARQSASKYRYRRP